MGWPVVTQHKPVRITGGNCEADLSPNAYPQVNPGYCYANYMGVIRIFGGNDEFPDLAPPIYRQRLVIEGYCPKPITPEEIKCYFRTLSVVCGMERLNEPVTHSSDKYGWAGWVHWEASGAHLYAWDEPLLFFSVDIYTCAEFDKVQVTEFTSAFFAAGEVVAKAF